jgi:hypothetical protein
MKQQNHTFLPYLFSEMFSDSPSELMETDIGFTPQFSLPWKMIVLSVSEISLIFYFYTYLSLCSVGLPCLYVLWRGTTWYLVPWTFFSRGPNCPLYFVLDLGTWRNILYLILKSVFYYNKTINYLLHRFEEKVSLMRTLASFRKTRNTNL